MIAGALEIQLLANVARLVKDMQEAKGAVASAMGSIEKTVGVARTALGALGVGLSVNYFKNFVTGAIQAQDELGKMSQRVGVSVERLAGLQHAAGMSGTSLQSVEKALKTVSTGLFDADKGLKGAQENFDALGVSIYDTNGQLKSADAVMIEVADQFAKLEDGTQKTALATKVFGRAGLELIPMLNEGSAGMAALVAEGQKYNPVTAESAAQAEIFNDNLDRLTAAGKGMGLAFVNNILPALAAFSQWAVDLSNGDTAEYLDTVKAAGAGLAVVLVTQVVPAFSALAGPIGLATAALVALIAAYDNLQRITNTAQQNSVANNIANGAEVITFAMYNVVQEINKAAEAMDNLGGGRSAKARREQLQAEIVRLTAELERYALALADTKKPTADATAAATVAGAAVVAYGEDVKFTIDAHDAHVEALEAYRTEQDKAREANNKARQSVAQTITALENEMLALQMTARAAAVFEAVTRATAEGALPAEIAKIAEATARLYDMKEAKDQAAVSAGVLKKTNEDAAKAAADNWQRTHEYLSTTFIDIANNGGNAFDNIAKSFSAMIQRMVAEWAASKLMNLFGMGGGGTATSAMGSIFGGGGGGGAGGSLINAAVSQGIKSLITGGGSAATTAAMGAGGAIGGVGAAAAGGTTAAGVGAASAAGGAGSMATITAMATNPATVAVAAALALLYAAKNDFFKDPDNYKRSYAGLLTGPTTGAEGSTFAVDPFASGFRATGIARGASEEAALAQIEVFRKLDAAGAELVRKLGGAVDLSAATLAGVGKEGTAGTAGTFLGQGGMTTAADIAAMTDLYMTQFADHITGLDAELLKAVQSAGSAEEVMKLLTDSVAEISETAKNSAAELSNMEQARKSASESILAAYNSGLSELDSIERAYEAFQKYAERGLTAEHISKFTGLMESEINAVIERGASMMQAAQNTSKAAESNFGNTKFWEETARQAKPIDAEFAAAIKEAFLAAGLNEFGEVIAGISGVSLSGQSAGGVGPFDGSHANGLDYVPFDGYVAQTHQGEGILTAEENKNYRAQGPLMARLVDEVINLRRDLTDIIRIGASTNNILDKWDGQEGLVP
jgi:hypothetical protein